MPRIRNLFLLLAGAALVPAVAAQNTDMPKAMAAVSAGSLTWAPIEVPGFASGVKMAVIQGNPQEAGSYTLRLAFPDGYRFPPHWHPQDENVTVLSGTMLLAMGDKVDDSKLKAYGPGDYLYLPATMPHFGMIRGATVLQLHGMGPFTITVVGQSSM